ncbi:hypothetical protein R5R35_007509 [Gryllus longicercus]|uniref:Cytochrome P450 n=1 Tax=Gryllus longicercus TaxID=2509291 RepID=A0AAN9YYK8_9ORTH
MGWWAATLERAGGPALGAALLLVALSLGLYLHFTRHFAYWRRRGVPFVPPAPFVGNVAPLFLLRRSIGGFARDLYRALPEAPAVGFWIFDKPALLIKKPELVKKILVKDFGDFGDRYTDSDVHADPLGQRNLFVIKGELWKYLRINVSPLFTSGKMKKMFHLVVKCDEQMVEYINKAYEKEKNVTLDLKEVTAKCTTDVISSCVFGINSNSLADPKAEFREFGKKTFEYTFSRGLEVIVFFFAPFLVKYFKLSFFQKDAATFLRKVFWDTIKAREESKTKRNDLIDLLIELKNKGQIDHEVNDDDKDTDGITADQKISKQFDFSGDDLVAQAAIFFVAGFETSASTMSFALYELALQPDLQTRLRNEIRDEMKKSDGKITYEMVFGMKYLDMVVSETLRKYPTLPFLDRVALRDYHDDDTGISIEKGTPIFISLLGLHTDPKYHPNPDRFDPERFSDEGKRKHVPFTYLPFGEGPHNCIGMRFGLMSAKTGIVHILAKYEVQPSERTPIPLVLNKRGVVTTTIGGVPLKFNKLND